MRLFARHQTRCNVCRHPDREAIEHDYLEWRSPTEIAIDYDISDRTSIYRHALATGLFLRRRRTFRGALERIMERAEEAEVTAASVVLAVRAYARINDDGKWVEPPQTIQVVRAVPDAEPAPPPVAATPPPPALPPVIPDNTGSEGSSPTPALVEDPQSRPNLDRNAPRSKSTLSD